MPAASVDMPPAPPPLATTAAAPSQPEFAATAAAPTDEEQRVQPTTPLTGRARDLVNADGTLRRPERRGPLAALRERLQR